MIETYESVLDVSDARMGDLPEIDELLRRFGTPEPADPKSMTVRVRWTVGAGAAVVDLWDLHELIAEVNNELGAYGVPDLPKPARVEGGA